MDREEVLARSKQENIYGDERDIKLRIHRDAFSAWGVVLLGAVMMVIKLFQSQSPADIISLLFCMTATASLYEALKTRRKVHVVSAIIFYLLTAFFFFKFCAGIF